MNTARYVLQQPLLVIGFFHKEQEPFKTYQSPMAMILQNSIDPIDLDKIGFKIMSIVPTEEHIVPIAYTDRKGYGYLADARCDIPEELWDNRIILTNQYPVASYGQIDTSNDLAWRFYDKDNKPIIAELKEAKLPWRYQTLDTVIDLLSDKSKHDEKWAGLLNRICETLTTEFTAWEVYRESIAEWAGEDIFTTTVKLRDGVNDEISDSCSQGPVSSLPGAIGTIRSLTLCDDHPDRLAVKKVQGETDSFGCEYIHMCQQCYDEYHNHMASADTSGTCDWCKKHKPHLRPHRDFEEGSSGPVYDVCDDCIKAENDRVNEELEDNDRY